MHPSYAVIHAAFAISYSKLRSRIRPMGHNAFGKLGKQLYFDIYLGYYPADGVCVPVY